MSDLQVMVRSGYEVSEASEARLGYTIYLVCLGTMHVDYI